MFGILSSAFNSALSFIFRSVIYKSIFFFGFYFVVTEFFSYLSTRLPTVSALSQAFANLPPSFWYFADFFGISTGLPLILAAYVLRFCIRRIPLIG